jgi:hypothetical protein
MNKGNKNIAFVFCALILFISLPRSLWHHCNHEISTELVIDAPGEQIVSHCVICDYHFSILEQSNQILFGKTNNKYSTIEYLRFKDRTQFSSTLLPNKSPPIYI